MSEKYLVSLQDLHDWYFHSLPFGETEKLNKWFEDHEFREKTCRAVKVEDEEFRKMLEEEPKKKESKEIVMCKDCAHFEYIPGSPYCTLFDFGHSLHMEEGFCAWGDRIGDK